MLQVLQMQVFGFFVAVVMVGVMNGESFVLYTFLLVWRRDTVLLRDVVCASFAVFSSSSQLSGLISTGYKLGLTSNLSGLVWYSSCWLTPVYFCFSHQIFRALKISAFPVLTLTFDWLS